LHHFIKIRPSALAQGRDSVGRRDALRLHGILRELGKLGAPQVAVHDVFARDPTTQELRDSLLRNDG